MLTSFRSGFYNLTFVQRPEKINAAWLRKLALNFEKRISKNTEMRAKFEGTPQKHVKSNFNLWVNLTADCRFMSSEGDLDADIKALSILAEHPELYQEFTRLGCVSSLVSLLSHDNVDIAIDAIEVIGELIDEDVNAEQEQWDSLVDAMIEADLLNLLYENITRLKEDIESDRAGVYHILSVLECLSSRPSVLLELGQQTKFIQWLLNRTQLREMVVSQNKQYSAEILGILIQSFPQNRSSFISLNGIDICLQLLSSYRKKDPVRGTEEEEYVENIFDCLTCCVDDAEGKAKFLEAEGVELCLIMLHEGKMSKPRAMRLLDHSLGGLHGGPCCERLVEAAGLKSVFGLFMKKQDGEVTEHILGIFASMLRSLPANSAPRIRLLAKFEEKSWRIINNLVLTRREVSSKVIVIEKEIEQEKARLDEAAQEERADEWLSRRLDAGLYVLQTLDIILAWLVAEDEQAKKAVEDTFAEKKEGLKAIRKTLQGSSKFYKPFELHADKIIEQIDIMDIGPEDGDPMLKDMIGTLIDFL